MNQRIKWTPLLAILLGILLGSLSPLQALAAEEAPRVVFRNRPNSSPDLYVTKEVENPDGAEIPGNLRFTFILKLNGKLAAEVPYRVFDARGNEIFNTTPVLSGPARAVESGGLVIPFQTSASGSFTLGAGETARFEYVGVGTAYEVTEVPREDFIQLTPAGGAPAVGTVPPDGAWVRFVNRRNSGKHTELQIQKTLSFPAGFKPPESPAFTFLLKLDGKPYAGMNYTVRDDVTGRTVGEGETDGEGRLTLKGGQTAIFTGIPVDVDYSVTEEHTPGWQVTGSAVQEGSTGGNGAAYVRFNNTNASFVVTKRLLADENTGEKPEGMAFTFLLTRGDRTVWADAPYDLYDLGGEPVRDEEGEPVSGATGADGTFVLEDGQAAIFRGIALGSVVNVSEVGSPGCIQVLPGTAEGYTDKVVSEAVEVFPFVNRPVSGGLTVTKLIENTGEDAPLLQRDFAFQIEAGSGDVDTYVPLAGEVYSIEVGGTQRTFRTDAEGIFTLKAGETARFEGLTPGTYRVTELSESLEYEPVERSITQVYPGGREGLAFSFVNRYTALKFDLFLHKENRKEESLSGAEFMLYRDPEGKNPVLEAPVVTGTDGQAHFDGLKAGTYYLVETRSPEGYQLLPRPIEVSVSWEEDVLHAVVDGNEVTLENGSDKIYITQTPESGSQVHLTVQNHRGFTLPDTGGRGLLGYLLTGMAGVVFLSLMLRRRNRGNHVPR